MDALRVSLIVVGILIVIAIYVYGRRQLDADDKRLKFVPAIPWASLLNKFQLSKRQLDKFSLRLFKFKSKFSPQTPKHPAANALEPSISTDDLNDLDSIVPSKHASLENVADDVSLIVELTSDQIAPQGEQLFIPLTILARHCGRISGESIKSATLECQFILKDSGIYYFEVADAQGYKQNLLGLANIMEPGTFDEEQLSGFDTPGLVLFLHLPAPVEAREAFDILLKQGRQLAMLLEGDLCDDARNVLTNQSIGHLKEKVEAYRFKQKMTQIKHRRS